MAMASTAMHKKYENIKRIDEINIIFDSNITTA